MQLSFNRSGSARAAAAAPRDLCAGWSIFVKARQPSSIISISRLTLPRA